MSVFASLVVQANLGILIAASPTAASSQGAVPVDWLVLKHPHHRSRVRIRLIPIESADFFSRATRWQFDRHRSL